MANTLYSNTIALGKKAKDGNSVEKITPKYGLSNDFNAPSTWSDTPLTIDSDHKYLWYYEITTFVNGLRTMTDPVIIGSYGDDGYCFTITILSSNGNTFRINQSVETTLAVQVLKNGIDITDTMEDYRFNWKRNSGNETADNRWNSLAKANSTKTVDITKNDCLGRTVFSCEVDLDNL